VTGAVTQFALSGLLTLLLLGVGGFFVLRELGQAEAIRDASQVTEVAGRNIVEPVLTQEVLERNPRAWKRFDEIIEERVKGPRIVRVKIWAQDGRIVYSDEPQQVGTTSTLGEDEIRALETGEAEAEFADLSEWENRFERGHGSLMEVYLGIDPGEPGGERYLFETYQRFSSITANSQRILLAFLPVFLAALLLLEVVQVPLAWSMARGLREGQREREALWRRAVDSSENERRRIAGALHDGVVQDMAGLSFTLSAAADRLGPEAPSDIRRMLRDAAMATRQNIRQLRTLLLDLHPPSLHDAGLEAALSDLLSPLASRGVATTLKVEGDVRAGRPVEVIVYRTAQEALRNVLAHAHASRVTVRLWMQEGNDGEITCLSVEDDGRGFSREDAQRRRAEGHMGLALLAGLVEDAGGILEIDSQPGRGTRLLLHMRADAGSDEEAESARQVGMVGNGRTAVVVGKGNGETP
jgi:two-component system, NarL family, sensor kinase